MPHFKRFASLLLPLVLLACAGPATREATVDRLVVLDCGRNAALDQSRWTPGIGVGQPIVLSDNCYLLQHGSSWLLWDTGYPDAVADKPLVSAIGTATRARTLVAQLAELGLKPADVQWVAVSHTHGDHVGNVDLFAQATLLMQKAEVDWAFAPGKTAPFRKERPLRELEGDLDVFGDGSVIILSTPGHTPGHQSLLLHLAQTGWVVLSGDLAHLRENWEARRVASMNTSAEQTQASMQRVAQILADKHAQLWINHDAVQSATQRHAPAFYR